MYKVILGGGSSITVPEHNEVQDPAAGFQGGLPLTSWDARLVTEGICGQKRAIEMPFRSLEG